jgi:hypothetical protein
VPAAAVIPAPIAYIKFAAVKASVVGFRSAEKWPDNLVVQLFSVRTWAFKGVKPLVGPVTLSKLECSRQAYA